MFSINRLVLFAILSFAVLAYSIPLAHPQHGHSQKNHHNIKRKSHKPLNERACKKNDSGDAEPISSYAGNWNADPTPTSSSKEAESTSSNKNTNNDDDSGSEKSTLLSALFPIGSGGKSWSTAAGASNFIDLSDESLGSFKNMNELSHDVFETKGKNAMRAKYPAGSYVLSKQPKGGFSFYAKGPGDVNLENAKEVTFGYSVYFPEDFDWVKGGKLPGVYGGDDEEGSVSCSGGSRNDECFSVRLMWRGEGKGELYTYLPPSYDANNRVCDVAPQSDCNPTYGASVGRGSFNFKAGDWSTISMRVLLNDQGKENGEIELFSNGKSVINVNGLVIRDSGAGLFRGLMMQTFFGGGSKDFATPRDQEVYFADLSVDVTKTF